MHDYLHHFVIFLYCLDQQVKKQLFLLKTRDFIKKERKYEHCQCEKIIYWKKQQNHDFLCESLVLKTSFLRFSQVF